MDFYERMVHWSWPTRLWVSGFFLAFSIGLLIYAHQLWYFGFIVGIVILLIPIFFREKHHEYQASDELALARQEWSLPTHAFADFLANLAHRFPRSLSLERHTSIAKRARDLKMGESATFSLHLKNGEIESPLELALQASATELIVRASARAELLSSLQTIASKTTPNSSV